MNWNEFVLGVDVWEGSLDIDEKILLDAGIKYLMIRINDTRGSLHLDTNFYVQWEQAKNFARGAYFVVAPWDTRENQVNWLRLRLPKDCRVVSLDVELAGSIAPIAYRRLVADIAADLKAYGYTVIIYTGAGYLKLLDTWPTGYMYWWARYPFWLYPATSVEVSWGYIKDRIAALSWSPGAAPGHVGMWQCSGDRYKLPGCAGRAIDLNVMPLADFKTLWPATTQTYLPIVTSGGTVVKPLYVARVIAVEGLNVRSAPDVTAAKIRALPYMSLVNVWEEKSGWARISEKGEWVSATYLRRA